MSESRARQLFHAECEKALNDQINMEYRAMSAYEAMSAYFDRDDVGLPNIAKFFKKSSQEEREHALKLIEYLNKRGGRVTFSAVPAPETTEFKSALLAFETALQLEKDVNASLLKLHATSDNHSDYQLSDFLEGEFLKEQVEASKELAGYVAQLKLVGEGLGVFEFDKTLH